MGKPKRPWFWFWIMWLATFVVAETVAIFQHDPGDTLSETIWFLQRGFWPLTGGLGVLFVFLIVHFLFDKRSRK
jgi:hypothetical protein